jgi:transposase, IS5 family
MRKRFEAQMTLGCTPIDQVEIPTKTRASMAALVAALQYIYTHPEWNRRVFDLLSKKVMAGKKKTGRRGMSLWEIFVLGQVRLCLNISYDELHYRANYDTLLRGILGVLPTDFSTGKQYEYQNIYDNVTLLDEALLRQINDVIVEVGHQVFKKKEADALRLKTDSFVVETDVHFPTDYNLLWDSARKCIDMAGRLPVAGWRKGKHWKRTLKGLMRTVGKISARGGPNKKKRLQAAASAYLSKARVLERKVREVLVGYTPSGLKEIARMMQLKEYHQMLIKHIDLTERRLLNAEKIPHAEKVFSIFLPWTELIKKGKRNPSVEFGKSLVVTSDQYHLMVDWQIAERQSDNELTLGIAGRLKETYTIQSLSVDKGFSDMADKAVLETWIPQVIMPKKGKRNQAEKARESQPEFKTLKNKHSAVESNINELEHRGLDRCPDRTRKNFTRYVGLAITAYNLHKIGKEMLRQWRRKAARKKAA